jgi:hypothetical protein
MKTRKRLLQALAIIGMASALGMTAKPAAAAAPRICTDLCTFSCGDSCGSPCFNMGCTNVSCTGSGGFYPMTITCY